MHWDDLRYMAALRRHATMSATARAMGTNVATVSRRLERFNAAVGQPCFARTVDGWLALPHIERILDLCENFQEELTSELHRDGTDPTKLVIGAPPFVNLAVLIPAMPGFAERNAHVQLELRNKVHEEGLGNCDIVLRGTCPGQGRLITRKIAALAFRMYRHLEWDGRNWVALVEDHEDTPAMRMAHAAMNRPPITRVAHMQHLAEAINHLRLAGPLPDLLAARHSDLVPVYPDDPPLMSDVWCCYHVGRKSDPTLRKTIDWIEGALSAS